MVTDQLSWKDTSLFLCLLSVGEVGEQFPVAEIVSVLSSGKLALVFPQGSR